MSAIPASTLVALAAVALSCTVSGAALVVARRAVVAGSLLVAGGLLGVSAAVLSGTGTASIAWPALVAAGGLFLPLALATYPRARLQHPVDVAALVVIVAGGVLLVIQADRASVLGSLGFVVVVTLLAHTWWRLERTDGDERRAILWMALAVGMSSVVGSLLGFAWEGSVVSHVATVVLVVVGPVLYLGVAAPQVVDVRGAVVGAVVTAIAVLAYTAVFVGLATLLELTAGTQPEVGAVAVVGALAALTLQPLRVVLRGVVDQLLFGSRPDPLDAAHALAGHIGDDPVLALHAIRKALVLPYAALRVDGTELATSGVATPHTHTVVLARDAELVVGLRAGDLTMSRGDRQVLDLAAPLLAQTLRAQALVAELHASRERTVAAIAEERRRLRRDLHDGLGPRLSGIAFTSDAARNLLRADPDEADRLLRTLRAETVTAIEDIRGLVYAMRPPALDELGLVGALRQEAAGLRTARGENVAVLVESAGDPSELAAAVEVAAYRIVGEALANVGRHSDSMRATVLLVFDSTDLRISVHDEGRHKAPWTAGVGLASMRDRAGELGGTLTAGPSRSGGRVECVLPLPT
jgi:two-component system, NarL family, sensor kinase